MGVLTLYVLAEPMFIPARRVIVLDFSNAQRVLAKAKVRLCMYFAV